MSILPSAVLAVIVSAASVAGPDAGGDTNGRAAAPAAHGVASGPARTAATVKAITAPSEDLTLAFISPGRIAEILVKEGQSVRAGQGLVRLDDAVEQTRLAMLKAKADNTAAVRAAELRLQRKRAVLARMQKAYDEKAAPLRELEDARLDEALARLDLETARFNHEQDRLKYREAELTLERMRLASPIDATVERIKVRVGQAVNALDAVIRLVRVEPLWIDVPVPLAYAKLLRVGDELTVRLPAPAAAARAEVIRISRVADAASGTIEVRLALPNPRGRPAGEQVVVELPAGRAARQRPGRQARIEEPAR
ncbi:MAG: efflux RND transporter periplasmic adaptor subunit [Planctomycetes bacterium]|nr:efflux RND transporter periplasmic adaptor subunit [Planctomycetota bacterium]